MDFLTINPKETALPQLHQYLLGSVGPRPICFASNLAPFSFFNVVSANPPVLVFAPNNSGRDGSPKHTYLNAKEVPEVVVNVVTYSMVQQMNVAAAPWDKGISEFEKAGFTPIASDLIKPLRVKESPVQMECRVLEIKEFGTGGGAGNLVMAEVLKIHINKDFMGEDGKIDQTKIDLVGRMGGSWYCRTTPDALFQLAQPMQPTIGYDALPENIKNSQILSANDIGMLAALPAFPDAEMVAKIIEKYGTENREETAKRLIENGNIGEALALLIQIR